MIDCIIKALEPALPERVPGAHFGTFSACASPAGAPTPARSSTAHDSGHGGWGACATHDGAGPFRTMAHGDTRIIPLELQESMYPFRVEEFRCARIPAAPANCAAAWDSKNNMCCSRPAELWANFDRIGCPPWGVQGAKAGEVRPGADLPRMATQSPSCFTKPKTVLCKPAIACAWPPAAAAVMAIRASALSN